MSTLRQEINDTCSRLEQRDDRLMAMSLESLVEIYSHDKTTLVKLLKLREQIIRARAQGY